MPDPLSKTAQEFAPVGGANMFDPTVGRDVIARYGVAGMVRDDMEKNLRLSGFARQERLGAMQEQETVAAAPLRAQQNRIAATKLEQEELDLLDKKEARGMQGEFLSELWGIRRDDPEYRVKVEDAMAALPPALRTDPAVEAWWDYSEGNLRDMDMRDRYTEQEGLRRERSRATGIDRIRQTAGGKGVDAEKEEAVYRKNIREDGTFDEVGYGMDLAALGFHSERETTKEDRKEIIDYQQENWMDRLRAAKSATERTNLEKEANEKADAQLETNPRAYPSPVDQLRIAAVAKTLGGKATGTRADIDASRMTLKAIDALIGPAALEEAEAQADNLPFLAKEMAREYKDDMEGYVNLVPGLSEKDKEARRDIWRVANKAWEAPAEKPAAKEDRVLRYNPETGLLE